MLEPVAGAGRGHDHVAHFRMTVDDKAEVARHRVQAGRGAEAARRHRGEVWRDVVGVGRRDLLGRDGALDRVGRGRCRIAFGRDLHAALRSVDRGKAVNRLRAAGQLPDERRKAPAFERRDRPVDVEPEQRLPMDAEVPRETRIDEPRQPGPGGEDQRACVIGRAIGGDGDAAGGSGERPRRLAHVQRRTATLRHLQIRAHAGLRPQKACAGLEVRALVVANAERRKARAYRRSVEHFVRDAEALGGGDRVGEESGHVRERRRAAARQHEEPAGVEQRRAGLALELAPDLVRAHRQR